MDIKKKIETLKQELVELRRDFHQNPELGFQEYRTQEKVIEYLKACGLDDVKKIAGTGVVALLSGSKPGKTVLLRSDMDCYSCRGRDRTFLCLERKGNNACLRT